MSARTLVGLEVVPYLDTPDEPTVEVHDNSGEVLIALDPKDGRALAALLAAACDDAESMADSTAGAGTATGRIPTTSDVSAWLAHNFGPERNVTEQALVLAEEVGELCRALVTRAQGIRGSASDWTAEIRKEAADAGIALLAIAGTEGFDLYGEMAARWSVISKRDFRVDPVGHGLPGGGDRG